MTIQQFLKIDKKVAERFQYAHALKSGWRHQNAPKFCNYCINELHIRQALCWYKVWYIYL